MCKNAFVSSVSQNIAGCRPIPLFFPSAFSQRQYDLQPWDSTKPNRDCFDSITTTPHVTKGFSPGLNITLPVFH
ncbi:hypothetical protein TNCV_3266711 [Trichonephila clavipes]|nr:hypothetical protein TNCV_3266711 [Trichonephila clavipes]